MPTNYNLPTGGTVNWGGYLGVPTQDVQYGVFPSVLQQGGFQEMPTLQDMYEIPLQVNGADIPNNNWGSPVITDDGWGSGRRRVGMLVYVLENQKLYGLIPNGYFNNGGSLGVSDWNGLTDAQKYELLDPTALYNASGNPFTGYTPNTPSGTSADCWVELEFGGDNIYNSNLAGTIAMTEDVGGMPTGTLVSDLSGSQTYDQLFDTILFPTAYPTASQPSTSLSDDVANLQVIGDTIDINLNTTASLGSISLSGANQGPYAGPVTAASISGETSYTLNVGPGDTDIDNQLISGYLVNVGFNTWTLTTTFDNGPMPLDSTGADYPSLQYTSGTKTNSTQFEGVYPIQLGTAAGNTSWIERALVSHTANNITCSQGYDEVAGGVRHRIAISDMQIAGRTVGFQQWNPVAGAYADLDASEFTSSAAVFTIMGMAVNYTVFTKASAPGGGDPGGTPIYRIKF